MFASKTTTFIVFVRGQKDGTRKLVIRPSTDTRYTDGDWIVTHDGDRISCESCVPTDLRDFIAARTKRSSINKVFIDEGHFYPDLESVVSVLLEDGIDVVVAGIDYNYERRPFENMKALEKYAKTIVQCHAICDCGDVAPYTVLKKTVLKKNVNTSKSGEIIVGGAEKYGVSCGSQKCDAQFH
mgnify:CR=1 FL=1